MKKIILITALLTSTISFAETKVAEVKKEAVIAQEVKVGVKGMVCAFCAQGIEKNFMKLPEVAKVEVSLEKKYVILKFKEGKTVPQEKIEKILKEAGYETSFGN